MATQTTDARKPDQFLETLNKGFTWGISHSTLLIGAIAAFVVIGGGTAAWTQWSESKESKLQEKYFVLEKRILDLRRSFDESERQTKIKEAAAKSGKPVTAPESDTKAIPATGDLAKDYGTIPSELQALIELAPSSKAGKMAALNLSDLQIRHGHSDEALNALSRVDASSASDLVSALVIHQKANLLAEKGDCKAAIGLWEKIVSETKARYLHPESKLRMGLCYEALNDLTKAEQLYTDVSAKEAKDPDAAATHEAEKYLRLLKTKKTRGS